MLNTIKNIFSGSGSNNNNVSEEAKENDQLKQLTLVGRYFQKKINTPATELSDDAEVSLSIVEAKNFKYSLTVKNNNFEFDNTDWEKQTFTITNDLCLKSFIQQGLNVLVWESKRIFYSFTILNDPNNKQNKLPFIQNLCNFIYSFDMDIHYKEVDIDQAITYLTNLGEVDDVYEFLDKQYQLYSGKEDKEDKIILNNKPEDNLAMEFEKKINITTNTEKNKKEETKYVVSFPDADILYQKPGKLLKYDKTDDKLNVVSGKALLKIIKVSDYKYYIQIDDYEFYDESNKEKIFTITCSIVNQELSLQGNFENNYVMWVGKNNNNILSAYNFIFSEPDCVRKLNSVINRCWYAYNYRNTAKDDDDDYLENMNTMEIEDDEDLEEEEDKGFSQSKYNNDYSEFENKLSTQSYLNDRTFVVKDNDAIVVYKTDLSNSDNMLEVLDSIPPVKFLDKDIKINQANMFLSDTALLLLDKSRDLNKKEDYIYKYDLEKMKVVEEYRTDSKINDINAFTSENRYGNMTNDQMLVGINSNNLFQLDPRINKSNKVAANREYAKSTKTCFKNLCTSSDGNVVVGSIDGKIRLYSNDIHSKTRAKTALPSLGDPILSVDITNDGGYILATCSYYLLVINTKVIDENGKEKDGFGSSITKNCKSLKLQLNPLDVDKYNLYNCCFTPARFNVGKTIQETNIVSSIGEYIVNWNFNKVKKGIKSDYRIKKMNHHVKNNEFMFDKNELIVTMDKNIGLQHKFK